MREVREFPHRVREVEHCWIPMADGCRLAARLWIPEGAERRPVPVVLEYIPYGKRVGTRERDEPMHGWFAGHGVAAARVDVRGSGDSDGWLEDEYSERELTDGEEVIRWLAAQPWSSGRVGMIGKSWGGIVALALAARRPAALGAIVTVCSTDDRWRCDAHYMGGRVLDDNLIWGSALLGLAALPPDPQVAGEGWRETWRERLERVPLYPEIWMRHPRRDGYWRHGSVAEDYSAIRCPVYAVGGWADAYRGSVLRLLAGLTAPAKGLIGPWAHHYPHDAEPGPAIGFLQECLRWWRRWLEGVDDGIMDEPRLRVWMPDDSGALRGVRERPGRWVAEEVWPSPRIGMRRAELAPSGEDGSGVRPGAPDAAAPRAAGSAGPPTVRSPETTGLCGGAWCPFDSHDLPREQGPDDAGSLLLDSAPLGERLEILGEPVAEVELSADRPGGLLAVRLCDVAPDGSSARVTYGLLDLGAGTGRRRLRLPLEAVAHAFHGLHRVRLAISTAYWPIAWPSPEPVTLTLHRWALELPVRPPRPEDAELAPFAPPEAAPEAEAHPLADEHSHLERPVESESGVAELRWTAGLDAGGEPVLTRHPAIALDTGFALDLRFGIRAGEPLSAEIEMRQQRLLRRAGWSVRVETVTRLGHDAGGFRLRASLEAWEGEERIGRRDWDRRMSRC